MKSICVYCGSSDGQSPIYLKEAFALGEMIASQGHRLVYGGGTRGLMGAVSRGVLSKNGRVLGIIPEFLLQKEGSSDNSIIVPDMHSRKKRMFDESDIFIALPGGIGTLEELVEILTWKQLKQHDKRVILLNINNYWSPFMTLIEFVREQGFIREGFDVSYEVIESIKDLKHL